MPTQVQIQLREPKRREMVNQVNFYALSQPNTEEGGCGNEELGNSRGYKVSAPYFSRGSSNFQTPEQVPSVSAGRGVGRF